MILGVDFVAEFDSQNDLSYFWRVFIQTWKNSLGDQAAPSYRQSDKMHKNSLPGFRCPYILHYIYLGSLDYQSAIHSSGTHQLLDRYGHSKLREGHAIKNEK